MIPRSARNACALKPTPLSFFKTRLIKDFSKQRLFVHTQYPKIVHISNFKWRVFDVGTEIMRTEK